MKNTYSNILGKSLGLVATMLFVSAGAGAQTTFYVNDNSTTGDVFTATTGDDAAGNGSASAPYATLTTAISFASAGDIIKVDVGTYNEGVTIDKSITVLGVQAGACATSRTGDESVIDYAGGLAITANNVTLDGFTIQGQNDETIGPGFGFGVFMGTGTSGTHLVNNIIKNNMVGASLSNAGASPAQALISCNWFDVNNQPPIFGGPSATGIYTDQFVSGGAVSNVLISSNTFSGNTAHGINIGSSDPSESSTGILVYNNDFNSNRRAVLLLNVTSSVVSANIIHNSTSTSTANAEFTLAGVSNSTFSNNSFTAGRSAAIRTVATGGPSSSNLTVTENSFAGYSSASKAIIVSASTMSGTLNAECNWFGTTVAATIATLNSGSISYTPWLPFGTDIAPTVPGFQPVPGTISLTSAASTAAQTVCINAPISSITYATGNTTGATFSGLPAGVTGSWVANVATITGTPTVAGTFNYTVTTAACGSVIATGTINVTDVLAATAVSPAYPLSGQEMQTIYLGYPSSQQTETISITPTGGTAPYSYTWTKSDCNGSTMSPLSNSGNSYTFAPTTADTCIFNGDNVYTFAVTVTDNNGCAGTTSARVNVVNPYVGDLGNSQVLLCHKVAVRGGATSQFLRVNPGAASAHLAHGDYLGNCPVFIGREAAPAMQHEAEEQHVAVYPNPTTGIFVLELSEVRQGACIIVTDVAGKLVSMKTLAVNDAPTATFDLSGMSKGMYLIQVRDGELNYRTKIVVQ